MSFAHHLDPFARRISVSTPFSSKVVLDWIRDNTCEQMPNYRNSEKLFVGTVSDNTFQVRYRPRKKVHDPRRYPLVFSIRGWVEREVDGHTAIHLVARPGIEFYCVPFVIAAVGFYRQNMGLVVVAALYALGQSFMLRNYTSGLRRILRSCLT